MRFLTSKRILKTAHREKLEFIPEGREAPAPVPHILQKHILSAEREKAVIRGRGCTAVCHIQPVRGDILYHGSPPYRCRRFSRYLRSSFSSTAPMTSSSHFTIRSLSFGRCPSTLMQFDAPIVAK